MLPDRFRGFFGEAHGNKPSRRPSAQEDKEIRVERPSRGLEQFFSNIRGVQGLSILDLGGAIQENIEFITNLGHRITTQAFLQTLDQSFGDEPVTHADSSKIEEFLAKQLSFADESFDGVLLWDTLQYLSPALLTATVSQLHRITRPGCYMLGFFNSNDKGLTSPNMKFRVSAVNTLHLTQRGIRSLAQPFNNRNLERLFTKFESVKFFLTREHLREVIVRR